MENLLKKFLLWMITEEAIKTADILNKFVQKSYDLLKDHPVNLKRIESGENPANIIIPRGAGAVPKVEPFGEKYGLNPVCIAETGLIKGIAIDRRYETN